jgi:hypothetical protein
VIDFIKVSPRSLNKVLAEIQNRWGIKLSKSTLEPVQDLALGVSSSILKYGN